MTNKKYHVDGTDPADAIREIIQSDVGVLMRSETGRRVASQLFAFLDGRSSNLDQFGWQAVNRLVAYYQWGYAGSVLYALSKAREPQ